MYGILFRFEANAGKLDELIEFLKWDAEVCRDKEPGTLSFEFYSDDNDENAIYVYEAYRDRAAFEDHKKHEPYRQWSSGLAKRLGKLEILIDGDAL